MYLRSCGIAVLFVGAIAMPARAQTRLEWKLQAGDQFFLQTASSLKQTIKSLPSTPTEETTTLDRFKVVKQDAHQLALEKTLLWRKFQTGRAQAERNAQIDKKLEGAVCTVVAEPDLRKIAQVFGFDNHLTKSFGDQPELKNTLATTLGDKAVKQELENDFAAFLPGRPVQTGDRWQAKTILSFGPMGEFRADGDYTYRGKENLEGKPLDRIDVTWTLHYEPPSKDSGLPYTIKKAELKTEKAEGTYFFDADRGRLVLFRRTVVVKGSLDVTLGGDDVQMDLQAEQKGTVQVLDKDPR